MFEKFSSPKMLGVRVDSGESQQGFTLIEMSIVLVIIGLIIGGIVKGEEVVASARLKSQIAQMDAIKGAVFTFQDKYGYLPGDLSAKTLLGLTSVSVDGNQDGYIDLGGTGSTTSIPDNNDVSSSTESPGVWLQLGVSGLLAGIQNISGGSAGASAASATTSLYPGKVANSYIWVANFTTSWGLVSEMARIAAGTGAPTGLLRETDASTIDSKFDDGSPGSGDIIAVSTLASGCYGSASSTSAGAYSLGGVNPQSPVCALEFILQ